MLALEGRSCRLAIAVSVLAVLLLGLALVSALGNGLESSAAAVTEMPAGQRQELQQAVDVEHRLELYTLVRSVTCQNQVCDCSWATDGPLGYCATMRCAESPHCPSPSRHCWDCCCSMLFPTTYRIATLGRFEWPMSWYEQFLWSALVIFLMVLALMSCFVIFHFR